MKKTKKTEKLASPIEVTRLQKELILPKGHQILSKEKFEDRPMSPVFFLLSILSIYHFKLEFLENCNQWQK